MGSNIAARGAAHDRSIPLRAIEALWPREAV